MQIELNKSQVFEIDPIKLQTNITKGMHSVTNVTNVTFFLSVLKYLLFTRV